MELIKDTKNREIHYEIVKIKKTNNYNIVILKKLFHESKFDLIIARLIKNDCLLFEETGLYINENSIEFLISQLEKKYTLLNNVKVNYNNIHLFSCEKGEKQAKIKAIENYLNCCSNFDFKEYNSLKVENIDIEKTLNSYKDYGFKFLFFDRTKSIGFPCVETVLLNECWHNMYSNAINIEKQFAKRYFSVSTTIETAITDSIEKVLYSELSEEFELSDINININCVPVNQKDFSNYFDLIIQNFEFLLFQNEFDFFASIFKDNNCENYEHSIYNNAELTTPERNNLNIEPAFFKYKLQDSFSINNLQEFLMLSKILKNKEYINQNKEELKKYLLEHKSVYMKNDTTGEGYINCMKSYLSYIISGYSSSNCLSLLQSFYNKDIVDFLSYFLNTKDDLIIFLNPFIFKV